LSLIRLARCAAAQAPDGSPFSLLDLPRVKTLSVHSVSPSVDVPLVDFFGVGHGYGRILDSIVIGRWHADLACLALDLNDRDPIRKQISSKVRFDFWSRIGETPASTDGLPMAYMIDDGQ
jgi:hypothetical protein